MRLSHSTKIAISIVVLSISFATWIILLVNPGQIMTVEHCHISDSGPSVTSLKMLLEMNPFHAGLDTFAGRNIKTEKVRHDFFCECGNEILKDSKKCVTCNRRMFRKVERPSHSELKMSVQDIGYTSTGKKYGVSDNSIRKWLRYYEKIENQM